MAKKFTFSTPSCLNCQYRLIVGGSVSETRYCTGFEKKKPRRFRKSDPRIKPPKWNCTPCQGQLKSAGHYFRLLDFQNPHRVDT